MWIAQVIGAILGLVGAITDSVNDAANRKLDWKQFKANIELEKEGFKQTKDNLVLSNDLAIKAATYNFELGIYTDNYQTQSVINGYKQNPTLYTDCIDQFEQTGFTPPLCTSIGLDVNGMNEAIRYRNELEAVNDANRMKLIAIAGLTIIIIIAVIFYKDEVKKIVNVS